MLTNYPNKLLVSPLTKAASSAAIPPTAPPVVVCPVCGEEGALVRFEGPKRRPVVAGCRCGRTREANQEKVS